MSRLTLLSAIFASAVLSACGGGEDAVDGSSGEGCADVESVEISEAGAGTYRFDVTVRSADTGWEKYADAWEVRDGSGTVLGTRELLHPHVDEQPFTRSLSGVEVAPGVSRVEVAARDSVRGFCGKTLTVAIP